MQPLTRKRVVRKRGNDAELRGIVRLRRNESGRDQGKESRSSQREEPHVCRKVR